jgi:hypothetical protein
MKIIALTVLLAVVQAPPPVPRKAANNSAQTATQIKSKSASDQAEPLPAPAPVKTDGNSTTKTDSDEQHPQDEEHTVGISKLPPVTVNPPKRDWADWGYWAFSGLLVIVGGLQVWLLLATLGAIRRQGDQMEHQTNALRRQGISMRRQTTILRKSAMLMAGQLTEMQESRKLESRTLILQYRPKIVIRNAKALNFSFELGEPGECELRFIMVNTGGSPAYIAAGGFIQLLSLIGHKVGKVEIKDGDQPGQQVTVEEVLPTGTINDLEWANFREGIQSEPLKYLYLIGTIYYLDDLNIPRSTGMHRKYDPKNQTFEPQKESESEYTD